MFYTVNLLRKMKNKNKLRAIIWSKNFAGVWPHRFQIHFIRNLSMLELYLVIFFAKNMLNNIQI